MQEILLKPLSKPLRNPLKESGLTSVQRAVAILRSFGSNASQYPFATRQGAYQTSAGPAATVVTDPIGLELDAMGVVGSELVIGGNFSNTADWTKDTGWTVSGGFGVFDGTVAFAQIANNGSSVPIGSWGRITFTLSSKGSNVSVVRVILGGAVADIVSVTGPGTYTTIAKNVGAFPICAIQSSSSATGVNDAFSLSYLSCVQVTGNHATQPTAINRPTFSALYNELTYTTDLNAARWNASAIAYTGGVVIPAATNAQHFFSHNYPDTGTPTKRLRVIAKAAGYQWLGLAVAGGGITMFDVLNGVIGTTQTGGTPTITPIGNGEFVCSVERAYVGQATYIFVQPSDAQSTWTPDGVSGIAVRDFDQRKSGIPASYPQYQRVTGDAANYDTAGFPFYASFNGTNSSLALASVPFQMADDHAVVMCVRLFGVAGDQCLFELSDGTSKRAASVRVNAASINVMWFDGSVAAQPYHVTPAVDGSVYVITAWKIGSTYSIRVNSVDGVAVTPTLTPYTGTQARIGSRCDNTEYTSSNIYDVIPIKGTVTDAQLLVLEKAAGLRAGLVI